MDERKLEIEGKHIIIRPPIYKEEYEPWKIRE